MLQIKTKKRTGNPMGIPTMTLISPKKSRATPVHCILYKYAQEMADKCPIEKGCMIYALVDGAFIFGDFIEALIIKNRWLVKELTISTLGYNQGNVDSLKNLVTGGYVEKINLLVSVEFWAFERSKNALIPYTYSILGADDFPFQLSVCDTHMKVINIRTECGLKICIHGSANIRSSGNLEQIMVQECENLYDFNQGVMDTITEQYKTVKVPIRKSKQWNLLVLPVNF